MNWDELYQKGEVFWDRGALVPGCGLGHEVALAVEQGLDATGLDRAPTGIAEARALYPHVAERFVTGSLFDPP